ncbi:MAG: substrate-binding domain-containing protein [Akkermansiaceae bacterium]|jgi:DNA-binding transcriptional regulator YhcF (GntR family)|nr:substrate-binding domain-containing protein [Akkermansiaceae bacterium]
MNHNIERRSLAVQIADRIGEEIRSGTWAVEIPGKRTLAERYGVNPKTCAEALCLLERRGDVGPSHAGRGRRILASTRRRETPAAVKSRMNLLLVHQSGTTFNHEEIRLLQRIGEAWSKVHGEMVWAGVDYARCKRPGPALDALIKRHAPGALLLHMPWKGWASEAAARLPHYQLGGQFGEVEATSHSASSLGHEVGRLVNWLQSLGHRRILFPTYGWDRAIWLQLTETLRLAGLGKPAGETWDDWCPRLAERIPEVCEGYWQKAFARVRPTAVVVFDDALLLSLYSYCAFRNWTIPGDLTVVLLNYDELFEWLRPRPTMMRYPVKAAVSHFQQWLDGGLKPVGLKLFELELIQGASVGEIPAPAANPRRGNANL